MIRASSGAGKSIYLNYLRWQRRKRLNYDVNIEVKNGRLNSANELSFDFEEAVGKVLKGKTSFPSNEYCISKKDEEISTPWYFFSMLLDSTFELIYKIILENSYKRWKSISLNFQKIYGENYPVEVEKIFNMMKYRYAFFLKRRDISTELLDTILHYCFKDSFDVKKCIVNILELLTRVIVCDSDLSSPRQVMLSFDNIEHFIGIEKRIYDRDISAIADSVLAFANGEEAYYNSKGMNFSEFFKIVLVIRDTTSKMLSANVHTYFLQYADNSIDVTNWYSTNEIYNNKLDFYSNVLEDVYASVEFFKLMIQDGSNNTLGTNIMQQVSAMYNHNKRRTTRILARVSSAFNQQFKSIEKNSSCLNFLQFSQLWETVSYGNTKYLCRQAILRLIFNEIARTGYFNRICNYTMPQFDEKNTYARRVLTWLSNENNFDTEEYMSFYKLLKGVLCCPDVSEGNISFTKILNLSEILTALDEYRFAVSREDDPDGLIPGPNRWCQLIIIKFNDRDATGILDPEVLAKKMHEEFLNKNVKSNDFGIRITEAGYFFARVLCNFEYFSCRYDENDIPLIFLLDSKKIEKTIKTVFNSAKKCIDNTILFENSFFNQQFHVAEQCNYYFRHISNEGNIIPQSLPCRIILQHRNYLLAYKSYIDDDELHEKLKLFSTVDRKEISACVQNYINLYGEISNKLINSDYKIQDTNITNYFTEKEKQLIKFVIY